MILALIHAADSLKILELQQRIHDLEIQTRSFWDAIPSGIGAIAWITTIVIFGLAVVIGYNAIKAVKTPKKMKRRMSQIATQQKALENRIKEQKNAVEQTLESAAKDIMNLKEKVWNGFEKKYLADYTAYLLKRDFINAIDSSSMLIESYHANRREKKEGFINKWLTDEDAAIRAEITDDYLIRNIYSVAYILPHAIKRYRNIMRNADGAYPAMKLYVDLLCDLHKRTLAIKPDGVPANIFMDITDDREALEAK